MCLAVPGRLVETFALHGVKMGRVDFGGVRRAVCIEHVPTAAIGDFVLVHVGFALTRLDPEEAARLFELYRELDNAMEEPDEEKEGTS
jgi:hydrogenase expression/formation protein HypC